MLMQFFLLQKCLNRTPKEGDVVKNRLKVKEVARLMGVSENFIRLGLQQGLFPWGYAVKTSSEHTYYISPAKFEEYTGIKVS